MKKLVIVDYGSGNLHSIAKAFEKCSTGSNFKIIVSNKISDVKHADRIVLPGVGAFGDCVYGLSQLSGMIETLNEEVKGKGKPFLGVCVGMQMLANYGFEHGNHKGLGWIEGNVVPIDDIMLKIPHMGWNDIEIEKTHPILRNVMSGEHFYFVHSYHFMCKNKDNILSYVDYGKKISAIIAKDNIVATQFHPEKSQKSGLKLISNFLEWQV